MNISNIHFYNLHSLMHSFVYTIMFLLGMVPPLPQINGYTHWSVTPNGMIVPITTSFFHLRQPWNIVKLFIQEDDCEFAKSVEYKLNQVSEDLKLNQDYQKKVHSVYVDSNSACDKASKLLIEFDLHSTHILTLEAKGIASQKYLNDEKFNKSKKDSLHQLQQPFCDKIFNRSFSMCCFEYLEAIRNRSKFEGFPEISLYKLAFPQDLTPSEYGHLVSLALSKHSKNPTHNWILYNMAAFYWRVKGSATNSIECLRAALHTSPNQYLDVALVSLANVLHLIRSTSKDALILMKNAVLISPHFSSHHIILGNIYASLGQFNDSLHHFKIAAQLYKPDGDKTKLKDIEDRIFAARCSYELSIAISAQQSNLHKQLKELDLFQHNTDRYHSSKTSIELNRVNNATQRSRQKIYEAYVNYEEQQTLTIELCSLYDHLTNQLVTCPYIERRVIMDLFQGLDNSSLKNFSAWKNKNDLEHPKYPRRYKQLFANDMEENQAAKFDCEPTLCFNLVRTIHYDMYSSINLSPRNKGFEMLNILTKYQGLDDEQEHHLPWNPPYCALYTENEEMSPVDIVDNLESLKQIKTMRTKDEEYPRVVDEVLLLELKKLVNDPNLRLEDIGQRIYTAMSNRLTPLWISLHIAALYWRVVGYFMQAVDCERLSAKLCPQQYMDIPFVNLAAILIRLNETDDSLKLIKAALQVDYSEPETHLLAAGLFKKTDNYQLAYQHYYIAMHQEQELQSYEQDWNFTRCQLCRKQKDISHLIKTIDERDEFLSISNVFLKHYMCLSIRECKIIISNQYYHLPHIKITVKGQTFSHSDIEGLSGGTPETIYQDDETVPQIMYGFLWNTNVSNLYILDHECVVINDSFRSVGCHLRSDVHEASVNAVKFLEELKYVIDNLVKNVCKENHHDSYVSKERTCHTKHAETQMVHDDTEPAHKFIQPSLHDDITNLITSRVVFNSLAPEDCEQVAPFDFKTYTPLYVSLNTMQINVVSLIDSLTPSYLFTFSHQPYCSPKGDNNLLQKILEKHKVDFETSQYSKVPEYNLHASFLKAFDDKYTLEEIGRRLYTGLLQNASDWRLATIIVNYWRVYGDAGEAFKCLELALETSPDYHLKVVFVNSANILYRVNKLEAALEVSYRALKCIDGQKWIVIPFLVANIFATMEQWQKATLFYESCLSIKANFEEAIYRIKSIQCQQMVLTNLEQH